MPTCRTCGKEVPYVVDNLCISCAMQPSDKIFLVIVRRQTLQNMKNNAESAGETDEEFLAETLNCSVDQHGCFIRFLGVEVTEVRK